MDVLLLEGRNCLMWLIEIFSNNYIKIEVIEIWYYNKYCMKL